MNIQDTDGNPSEYLTEHYVPIIHLSPPTFAEVKEIVIDLKSSAAVHDEISIILLKEVIDLIVAPLTHIQCVPNLWNM